MNFSQLSNEAKGLIIYELENNFLDSRSLGAMYPFEIFSTDTLFDCAGHSGLS